MIMLVIMILIMMLVNYDEDGVYQHWLDIHVIDRSPDEL
jgi:hypothetical protein